MSTTSDDTKWYWCFLHNTAEHGATCRAVDRLGPYDSAEEAANWRERVKRRNQQWDDEDERWDRGGAR